MEMSDLQKLSIADLKATLDYINVIKKELIDDLKEQKFDTKNNHFIEEYDRVEFLVHRELSKRIDHLKKI